MTDKDNNDIEETVEMLSNIAKKGAQWWDNNKDMFVEESGGGGSIDMSGPDPLREAHVDEDSVKVISEVQSGDISSMGVNYTDEGAEFILGDESFMAELPDDIDPESIDATMKNGVLRVEFDRVEPDEPEEIDIDDTIEDEAEDLVDELFDDGGNQDTAEIEDHTDEGEDNKEDE